MSRSSFALFRNPRACRPFLRLGLAVALAVALTGCPTAQNPDPSPEAPHLGLNPEQVWSLITVGDPDAGQPAGVLPENPSYASWPLFPGPPDDPDEFDMKRLGIATHGRYVTVRALPSTADAIQNYLGTVRQAGGDIPAFELPAGSILVKINYPNVNEANTIAPAALPSVLTVLYKPGGDFCQTGETFNGMDCLGGGWAWLFYGIEEGQLKREGFDKFIGQNPQAFCINCHDPGFHTDYLRGLERLARQAAHEQKPTANAALPPQIDDADPLCEGVLTASSRIPPDVARNPADLPQDQRQRLFDCFAWRAFVALNWPAAEDERGEPASVGFADRPAGDRVWETYKATWEVFQPEDPDWDPTDPANPASSFDSPRPLPPSCPADTDKPVLTMVSKSNSRFPDARDVANESGQAFAGQFGTLTDRNGNWVRYQVLFNETEFDFMLPTAITKNLTPAGPNGGAGVTLPDGSMEIKASWKELCTEADCQPVDVVDDYYHREVLVFDAEKETCEPLTMGLTGLHVTAKTFWAPQWIWATFEHESNSPMAGTDEIQEDRFSFYDPDRSPTPGKFHFVDCSTQPFLAPKGKPDMLIGDPDCPNVPINRWPELGFGDTSNQISRLQAIGSSGLNEKFHSEVVKGTPFEHYLLVDTQWPMNGRRPAPAGEPMAVNTRLCPDQQDLDNDPDRPQSAEPPSDCYTMVPSFLRNTSMESYMSTYVERDGKAVQISNRSCMGCHASGTDFSYIWADAVEQIVPFAASSQSADTAP